MPSGAHRLHDEFTHAKKHLGLDLLLDNYFIFTTERWKHDSEDKTTCGSAEVLDWFPTPYGAPKLPELQF